MVRLIVCHSQEKTTLKLFNNLREVISRTKAPCELSYCMTRDKIVSNIKDNIEYYDVYFVEAENPNIVSLCEHIRHYNFKASIVFISKEETNAEDFLYLRPSAVIRNYDDLKKIASVMKLVFTEQTLANPFFTIKNKDEVMRIRFDDIYYLESRQRIVAVHAKKCRAEFYAKLGDVFTRLPQGRFIRCHQSYVVNLACVRNLNKSERCFELYNGEIIEISKSCYTAVVEEFTKYVESTTK